MPFCLSFCFTFPLRVTWFIKLNIKKLRLARKKFNKRMVSVYHEISPAGFLLQQNFLSQTVAAVGGHFPPPPPGGNDGESGDRFVSTAVFSVWDF